MVFQAKATGQSRQRKRRVKVCGYAGVYWFLKISHYLTDISQFFFQQRLENHFLIIQLQLPLCLPN